MSQNTIQKNLKLPRQKPTWISLGWPKNTQKIVWRKTDCFGLLSVGQPWTGRMDGLSNVFWRFIILTEIVKSTLKSSFKVVPWNQSRDDFRYNYEKDKIFLTENKLRHSILWIFKNAHKKETNFMDIELDSFT